MIKITSEEGRIGPFSWINTFTVGPLPTTSHERLSLQVWGRSSFGPAGSMMRMSAEMHSFFQGVLRRDTFRPEDQKG